MWFSYDGSHYHKPCFLPPILLALSLLLVAVMVPGELGGEGRTRWGGHTFTALFSFDVIRNSIPPKMTFLQLQKAVALRSCSMTRFCPSSTHPAPTVSLFFLSLSITLFLIISKTPLSFLQFSVAGLSGSWVWQHDGCCGKLGHWLLVSCVDSVSCWQLATFIFYCAHLFLGRSEEHTSELQSR